MSHFRSSKAKSNYELRVQLEQRTFEVVILKPTSKSCFISYQFVSFSLAADYEQSITDY